MSALTDLIALVAPRTAARMVQHRHAYTLIKQAYDAARPGRRTQGWLRPKTSARAETEPALVSLRASVRDLVRNNPHASIGLRRLSTYLVGEGIKPRFDGVKPRQKVLIRDGWARFVDNADPEGLMDLYGIQALAVRTFLESGEALIRLHPRASSDGFNTPLQISVLEPDHIDHTLTKRLDSGNLVIQGVEYDRFGRRAAYWLFADHPGNTSGITFRSYTPARIDAAFIKPVFEMLRPGQVHGVPMMTPAVMPLRDIADYDEAERVRKKIAACFVAFVQNDGEDVTGKTETDALDRQTETVSPGMIKYLRYGEQVTFGTPQDSGGYSDYMSAQLHAVAAGCGIQYHELTGDLTQANYSSLREGKIQTRALVKGWQAFVLEPMMCRPIWNEWWKLASVERPLGQEPKVKWSRPPMEWVDPKKDAEGTRAKLRMGITTLPQALADQGLDPDDTLDEIAETQKRLDSLGLKLESDARNPVNAGDTQQTQDQESNNAASDDD